MHANCCMLIQLLQGGGNQANSRSPKYTARGAIVGLCIHVGTSTYMYYLYHCGGHYPTGLSYLPPVTVYDLFNL